VVFVVFVVFEEFDEFVEFVVFVEFCGTLWKSILIESIHVEHVLVLVLSHQLLKLVIDVESHVR
jgi:hypothetical protein